jgi:hypothetical protein
MISGPVPTRFIGLSVSAPEPPKNGSGRGKYASLGPTFRGFRVRLTQRLLGGFPLWKRHHRTSDGGRIDVDQRAANCIRALRASASLTVVNSPRSKAASIARAKFMAASLPNWNAIRQISTSPKLAATPQSRPFNQCR